MNTTNNSLQYQRNGRSVPVIWKLALVALIVFIIIGAVAINGLSTDILGNSNNSTSEGPAMTISDELPSFAVHYGGVDLDGPVIENEIGTAKMNSQKLNFGWFGLDWA